MYNKRLYDIWRGMVNRCHNKSHISYPYYGAKGVTVCEQWRNSYVAFFNDMGVPQDGLTIDRIDNTRGYSKENCRWATVKEQNNNKSDTRHITFNGKTMNMTQWAKEIGTSPAVLHHRIAKLGLPPEVALTVPVTRIGSKTRFSEPIK